jgi:hypothetical protein
MELKSSQVATAGLLVLVLVVLVVLLVMTSMPD